MIIEGTNFKLLEEYSDYPYKNAKVRTRMYKMQCSCGNIVIKPKSKMTGNTKTIKCKDCHREDTIKRNYVHGLRNHECANIFYSMHRRCYNKKHNKYNNYGGRGIFVCDEWHDIATFIKWCENNNYKKGLQIDRIDNNKGYSPDNCRFVRAKENLMNRECTIIKEGLPLNEWLNKLSIESGISSATLRSRFFLLKKYYNYTNDCINKDMVINYKNKKRQRQSITNPKEKS